MSKPTRTAQIAASNIWLILTNYGPSGRPQHEIQEMIANEVQKALDQDATEARQLKAIEAGAPSQFVRVPVTALCDLLTEIIGALNYQPDIPLEHKTDMLNALVAFKRKCGIELPQQPKERAT